MLKIYKEKEMKKSLRIENVQPYIGQSKQRPQEIIFGWDRHKNARHKFHCGPVEKISIKRRKTRKKEH